MTRADTAAPTLAGAVTPRVHGARAFQASVLLRIVAIIIAVAGLIDPAMALSGASRARIAIVARQPPEPAADGVRDRLARDLGSAYEIVPQLTSDAAAAIVIGDRCPDESVPDALLVATVTTPADPLSGARIVRVDAPREIPAVTVIPLGVAIEGARLAGHTIDVTAVIAGLEVGRASHTWAEGETRWHASIDAVPVGAPPYLMTVRLSDSATATSDTKPDTTEARADTADVVVDVRRALLRVQFYDARPSWATTFLRRALEADARFQVAGLGFSSRGVSVQTGGAVPLGDPRLDAFDVVIVGGLDRLSAADTRALDRYMRERGGAVVVVPDQRIESGPARDLVAGSERVSGSVRLQPSLDHARGGPERVEGPDIVERLLEQPATLTVSTPAASLRASELLVISPLPAGSEAIAHVPGGDPSIASGSSRAASRGGPAPVIVLMPRGDGRLLLSGAMDAWRFRATDNGAFDRFWQSTIAGLALAVPPAIDISIEPPLLRPGERAGVIVRVRSRDVTSVSASIDEQPIRLRPEPEAGLYRGHFSAGAPGRAIVEARVTGAAPSSASRTLLVQAGARRAGAFAAPSLSMLASSHRGIDVTPDRIAELEQFVRTAVAAPLAMQLRHPMRSVWWILPFAGCLSAEWWLRRRRGLR